MNIFKNKFPFDQDMVINWSSHSLSEWMSDIISICDGGLCREEEEEEKLRE